jgi:hypothetical protein
MILMLNVLTIDININYQIFIQNNIYIHLNSFCVILIKNSIKADEGNYSLAYINENTDIQICNPNKDQLISNHNL